MRLVQPAPMSCTASVSGTNPPAVSNRQRGVPSTTSWTGDATPDPVWFEPTCTTPVFSALLDTYDALAGLGCAYATRVAVCALAPGSTPSVLGLPGSLFWNSRRVLSGVVDSGPRMRGFAPVKVRLPCRPVAPARLSPGARSAEMIVPSAILAEVTWLSPSMTRMTCWRDIRPGR